MDLVENEIVPVLYCIMSLVGIIGNGLVIFFILKSKERFKSPTEVYVGNLALADFLFVATLPFWAHDLYMQEWTFGTAACKMMSSICYLNMFGSIFFLTMMGIDRRLAVVQAVASRKNRTVRSAWIRSVIVWTAAFPFAAFPMAFRVAVDFDTGTGCVWDFPEDYRNTLNLVYSISRMLIGFVIPLGVICFCYFNIILFLRKRNKMFKKNFKELSKVTRMVAAIVICFVLAWLPNQVVSLKHLLATPCPVPDNYAYDDEYEDEWPTTSFTTMNHTDAPTTAPKDYLSTTNSTIPAYLFNLNTMISQTTESQLDRDYSSCHSTMRRIHMITVCLGFSNSIMNPFIYAFFASIPKKKFGSFTSLLNTMWIRRRSSQFSSTLMTVAATKNRSTAITSDINGKDRALDNPNRHDGQSRTASPEFERKPEEIKILLLNTPEETNGQNSDGDIWMGPVVK